MIRGRARRRAAREQARRERLERTAKAGRLIRLRVRRRSDP